VIDGNGDGVLDGLVLQDDAGVYDLLAVLKEKISTLDIKDRQRKNLLKRVEDLEKIIEKRTNKDKPLDDIKKRIINIINRLMKSMGKDKVKDKYVKELADMLDQVEIDI
jgi:hypothetical protein